MGKPVETGIGKYFLHILPSRTSVRPSRLAGRGFPLGLLFLFCLAMVSRAQDGGLQGPYLGQKPPALRPAVFAPGLVSTEKFFEFSATFSPDGDEFYFTRRADGSRNAIYETRLTGEGWMRPRAAAFSGVYDDHEPSISPGGRRLYWGSERPLPDGNMMYRIWLVERAPNGWGPPRPLLDPVVEDMLMSVSFTGSGTLYSTGIIRSSLVNGRYQRAVRLGPPVNNGYINAHPFIARDESFLIFDSNRPGNFGRSDLFISFRSGDDHWSEPQNLGREINLGGWNSCPMVTPDGRFFFFSVDGDIYWIDADYLRRFSPGTVEGIKAKERG